MNELYVWCMMNWGNLPDSRYTGTLQKQSEVSMCALWMSAIGSRPHVTRRSDGSVPGLGRLPRCCGLNGFLGQEALVFLPCGNVRSGQEENLPVWHPNRGSGFLITHSLRSRDQTGFRAGLTPFRSLSWSTQTPPVTVWQELFWCFLVQLLNVQCVM